MRFDSHVAGRRPSAGRLSSETARRLLVWLVVVGLLAPAWAGLGVARAAETATGVVLDPSLDETLGSGFNALILAVVETADGGFLVGGAFTALNGDESIPNGLVRFDAEGNLDTDFNAALGTGFGGSVRSITPASGGHEGSFYVGGDIASLDGTTVHRVVRLDDRGVLDFAFDAALGTGAAATGNVYEIQELVDGDVLVGGTFTEFSGQPVPGLARLSSDGEFEATFSDNVGALGFFTESIVEDRVGRILIGGGRQVDGDQFPLKRFNAQGELDLEFNSRLPEYLSGSVHSIALDESDRILIGGNFYRIDTLSVGRLARFSSEGDLDTAFNANLGAGLAEGNVWSVDITTDGILVAGTFTSANGAPAVGLARVRTDGVFDTVFNAQFGTGFRAPLGGGELRAVRSTSNGIVVGGGYTSLNGDASVPARLARLVPATIEMGTVGDQRTALGQSVDLALSASIDPASAVQVAATGLPLGLALDPATRRITGTPTEVGEYPVQVTAQAAPIGPRADITFTWTVGLAPTVSGVPGVGTVGEPYEFTFDVTGDPVPSVALAPGSVLPAGLTLSEAGVLSGTPTAAGSFEFTVVVSNGLGADATSAVSVRVDQAPSVSGVPGAGVVGEPYEFTFDVAGSPAPSVTLAPGSELPAGLTLSPTGVLSGVPTTVGDVEFTVTAANGVGVDASATVTMRVDEPVVVQAPWLRIVHAERAPGQEQVVTGGGFVPGEQVALVMTSEPVNLGVVLADADGRVDSTFTVPADTAAGTHTVTATGQAGAVASATFVVLSPGTDPGPGSGDSGTGGGQLAGTGAQVALAALVAAALIALGAVLVRRRHTAS